MHSLFSIPRAAIFCWALHGNHLAADWHEFRGPAGNGVVTNTIPTQWSATENVLWSTEVPGEGWSSPIVVDNTIFLTAAIPVANPPANAETSQAQDLDLCLLAFDASNGQLKERISLFTELAATAAKIHQKNSHASPTPYFDGTHLYVHFGHQGTACVSTQGAVLWRNASLGYPPVHGNGGSPVVVDGLLIFSRDGKDISEVTALDKLTGQIVWQRERQVETSKRFSFCTPLVLNNENGLKQLIIPGSDVVQSLNPLTGEEIWRVRYTGYSVIPRPIYESGLVFVSTSYDRPSLLAIDPSGQGDVTESHVKWSTASANIPHTPSLVGMHGKVAMVSDKGIAAAYDALTGKELWKERIGGNFSASPLLVGSLMYLLSEEGDCTVLDIADIPTVVAKNKLDARTLASPAVIGNDLLIRTDKALMRIQQ